MRSTMAAMLCCIGPCTSRAQQNQACSWLGAQHATRHASLSTRRPSLSTLYSLLPNSPSWKVAMRAPTGFHGVRPSEPLVSGALAAG